MEVQTLVYLLLPAPNVKLFQTKAYTFSGGGGAGGQSNIKLQACVTTIFLTPPKRGFLSCQNDILNIDFSVLFSQNLTPKWGFAQEFTPKSDKILEKVPYFLKMAAFDTLSGIPRFTFQSEKTTLIPCFLGQACLQYYTSHPRALMYQPSHIRLLSMGTNDVFYSQVLHSQYSWPTPVRADSQHM